MSLRFSSKRRGKNIGKSQDGATDRPAFPFGGKYPEMHIFKPKAENAHTPSNSGKCIAMQIERRSNDLIGA